MPEINVTAGDRYLAGGTISEKFGKDITTCTFEIALSTTDEAPPDGSVWVTPTLSEEGAKVSDRVLLLLVNSTTAHGTYSCWGRVTDDPERKAIQLESNIIVK